MGTLSNESYSLWLRAQRPPFELFMELDVDQQLTLALIGDAYISDLAIALGYTSLDPETADLSRRAVTDPDAEEILMRRELATILSQRAGSPLMDAVGSPRQHPVTAPEATQDVERVPAKPLGRSFGGRTQ